MITYLMYHIKRKLALHDFIDNDLLKYSSELTLQ